MPFASREAQREYQQQWIRDRRAQHFAGKSCEWCGSTEQLELDHIDPTKKISHNIWSWSAKRRAAEIAKCQILCRDCHQTKTFDDRPTPNHGTNGRYKRGCRCEECRAWNRDRVRTQRARTRLRLAA